MNGYCSDITRMFHVGEPSSEIADTYAVLYAAQEAGVQAARVGTAPVLPNSYSAVAVNNGGDNGFQANFGAGRGYASRSAAGSSVLHALDRGVDAERP